MTDLAYARISPTWWPVNPGAALVIPREHHENLYDLPPAAGHAVWDLTQRVAVAMRAAYACDGTSTRQHNEPAGGQDVLAPPRARVRPARRRPALRAPPGVRRVDADERAEYAERLAAALALPRTFG